MAWCEKCHDIFFGEDCSCKEFTVIEDGEEYKVFGKDFEQVVEKRAEQINCDEPIFNEDIWDEPLTVIDGKGVKKRFNASCEPAIDYYIEEVD